jgi:DnaJ-domain-containing protein 1
LDSGNFYKLDERTATAFVNGTWEILAHYEDYRRSFNVLDLPESADLPMIKKRFRQLAKRYHPDRGVTSNEKFHEINNAYQLLLHIYGMMKLHTE